MTREARICKVIEIHMAQDVGRGSAQLALHTTGMLLDAAKSLLAEGTRIAIITGFFIPSADPPGAETDGPVGAAQLAAALTRLNKPVEIITDTPCASVVACALEAAGCVAPIRIAPLHGPEEDVSAYLEWEEMTLRELASQGVTHMISIERPGPGASGMICNMRGEDISAHTAPLHHIFHQEHWQRIGIGDGGNELGMGLLPSHAIASAVAQGAHIHCTIPCETLLVGGTSNWAATGLVAALVVLSGSEEAELVDLLGAAWSWNVLDAIVTNAGAVDGVSKISAPTVDGLTWEEYALVLEQIRAAALS